MGVDRTIGNTEAVTNAVFAADPLTCLAQSTVMFFARQDVLVERIPEYVNALANAYHYLQPVAGTGQKLPIPSESEIARNAAGMTEDHARRRFADVARKLSDKTNMLAEHQHDERQIVQVLAVLAQREMVNAIEALQTIKAVFEREMAAVVAGKPNLQVVGGTDRRGLHAV